MDKDGKILYLECNTGISGDMTVASLLDLGADEAVLRKVLSTIPIQGFTVTTGRVNKAGLDVCDFAVVLDKAHENHDHDMEYLHGHEHSHVYAESAHNDDVHEEHVNFHDGEHHHEEHHIGEHVHSHEEEHHHGEHEHHHEEHGHHHSHEHRGLPEILEILEHTEMTGHAKQIAIRIFRILAKAEAKAHGVPENEVYFHEVGAVDSIVDIVAAAVCLDNLGIERCVVPKLCEGTGTVRCQHGILPVPVPAVLNIVQENGLKLSITEMQGEFVTPTGAAIAAAVMTEDTLPERFTIVKTGMGAGKRKYERPSILRAMLIEEELTDKKECDKDVIYKLETNIDDCSGEMLGYVMERLFEAGARDVHYSPVYMKKNRPAYQLNVICDKDSLSKLEQIIFRETTTIGIRRQKMERSVLSRKTETVQTCLGEADVKVCECPGQTEHLQTGTGASDDEKDGALEKRYYPEYDSVVRLCRKSGKSFQEVYHLIAEACEVKVARK